MHKAFLDHIDDSHKVGFLSTSFAVTESLSLTRYDKTEFPTLDKPVI